MIYNKVNKKYPESYLLLLLAVCFLVFIPGCSKDDDPIEPEKPLPEENFSYEILREYSFSELKKLENDFLKENIGISGSIIVGSNAKYDGDVQLRVYKVTMSSKSPNGSDKNITLSGVLVVPPQVEGREYRQVIAPPYTYIMKDEAPTLRIANNNIEPNLLFWMLEAYAYGYAVIVPDYPGFGDSYGQCYIPYVEKEPMVRTTVEFVEAAQSILEKEKYEKKGGFIISGYSLGAYVSLQLGREFETNSSHKGKSVDFLIVGGAPCDLLQEANLIRASESMPQPYLFPLALLGYTKNGYQHLVMSDYLKEPYASQSAIYLDGQHDDFNSFFPKNTQELFTEAFLKNENMDEVNSILEENSVKPWINSCKFIMTHGEDDETVYYAQARDFASAHNQNGGRVTFSKTSGTHTGAGGSFFLRLYLELFSFEK
ncbi:MAG: alpha/beta hydrolase [Tannerella sp.]|nr:alpha/beta hydrolase [Tannerella sp.]